MRILIKGGVWKNTEDEILKAAVMKYGKNQWARVASLLNRKSAKQCKARWYEWLDPSIKKTEWTREEEEKLLHLAKLMPNQWRTIAPIVGRTAGQCMEHYERLLDQAQTESSAAGQEMSVEDPRRLRPGEIDTNPETKPARPDPIDMDEDEKEMLSEARARLANTKGKKAKRKARERMLEESRRLSMLQKRRELKAAGIESRMGLSRKRKYMDYAREIPFQKVPPVGFYDVSEENAEGKKNALDAQKYGKELSEMEGRHEREEEDRQRKKDAKRLKDLFKTNAPEAILKMSEEGDPSFLRHRLPLNLPSPQISENELEEIVKLGKNSSSSNMGPPTGFHSTQGLLNDYTESLRPSQMSGKTPLRTPQLEDILMQEARNLRALREMTPLTTTELPELYEGTGFEGVQPRKSSLSTPNVLASVVQGTPLGGGGVPGTPGSTFSELQTPGRSVSGGGGGMSKSGSTNSLFLRDQFGLNNSGTAADTDSTMGDNYSVSDISTVFSRVDKNRSKLEQQQLLQQLRKLPEPEFTYEVAIPGAATVEDVEDEDDEENRRGGFKGPEDRADIESRRQKKAEELKRKELERRSQTMKKGLPRPLTVNDAAFALTAEEKSSIFEKSGNSQSKQEESVLIRNLVYEEMNKIILYEEMKYPTEVEKGQPPQSSTANNKKMKLTNLFQSIDEIDYEIFPKEDLLAAEELILEELHHHQLESDHLDMKAFNESWETAHKNYHFIPSNTNNTNKENSMGEWKFTTNEDELIESYQMNANTLTSRFEKTDKKISKLESKHAILTQGYKNKLNTNMSNLMSLMEEYNTIHNNYDELKKILHREVMVAEHRFQRVKEETKEIMDLESVHQKNYENLYIFAKSSGVIM
jgi:pre-mRNA-splicing factor CDC5/CEF1